MAGLELKNIRKSFGPVEVIKGVDLSITHGEFVVFVGPSGCGKSTLLRMIAGLEDITGGDILIGNDKVNDVEPRNRGVAMVFQSYALYPHMTVYDNVGFALKLAKTDPKIRDKKIRDVARILQMEELLARKPAQLSGGQRQRVAIGRAIVREPDVFLFDEPLSNLDAALRVDMRMELSKLHQNLDATMIYVTHDQIEAMTLADKIVVLDGGAVQQVGSPLELYNRPANLFVAGFIGSPKMNFLQVEVLGTADNGVVITGSAIDSITLKRPPCGLARGDTAVLGLRPQAFVTSETGSIKGTVELVERLGHETIIRVHLKDGSDIMVALQGQSDVMPGDTTALGFDHTVAHLFGADGARI